MEAKCVILKKIVMRKPISLLILTAFLTVVLLYPAGYLFAQGMAVDYLCEIGATYYRMGQFDNALNEFQKVLLIEPNNQTAKDYISNIFSTNNISTPIIPSQEQSPQDVTGHPHAQVNRVPEGQMQLSRSQAMNDALETVVPKERKNDPEKEEEKKGLEVAGIKISGEAQLRLGITSKDIYWKRANWDLNEKNYRILSTTALDQRENTYDPRIYDRLKLMLDTEDKEGLVFHSNLTIDPWSFTGRSDKVNLIGAGGDAAQIELKYWGNTGYTINESVTTLRNGDSFNLPEMKIYGNKTSPVTIQSGYNNLFSLPEIKIDYKFQPVREFWFDYIQDETIKLRVYPTAYENQAKTFNDPLRLSNNRIWWEDSPWIRGWTHGNQNSGTTPVDYNKGYWDNSLSFFTRDSEGQRLTSLRGISFDFNPQDTTSISTSVATPQTLWQDYSDIDNFLSATRIIQTFSEDFKAGATATTRAGYNLDNKHKLDAWNYVFATDIAYHFLNGIKTTAEFAHSESDYDISNSTFRNSKGGNAYHLSLFGRFPFESIADIDNYDILQPEKDESSFTKFRLFAVRMDKSFDEPLSSYVETRDDEWWGRHLHFRKPFKYSYQGEGQLLTFDDIKNYKIGNGVYPGRNSLGLRVESLFLDRRIENLFDVRNVHATNGKFIENVSREELTWKINDKLTSKVLGIFHQLPQTQGGIDPYIFNTQTGEFFLNDYIDDNKSASVATGSLGLNYDFFKWLSLSGTWEYTNDISLGYDNFPRGILNSGNQSLLHYENDQAYRSVRNWLYDQQLFPKPPYPYYNVFKSGLSIRPMETLEFYIDYTRNPYEKAGQVDDNMNHIGFEVNYSPIKKISLFFRYNYSRWQDLDKLVQGITKLYGHHNFFTEFIYRKSADEDFALQYGESSRDPYNGGVLDIGWDPYGGSTRTIDTQHIVRAYYRRKF